MKSCNAKRRRQRRRTVNYNSRSNQQKSNFARAAHFFVHFFAVVLHDYNVKLPETSQLHVLWRKCRSCLSSLLFFTAAHFHLALVATSISHFVTAATKFSCCSSNKKMAPLFFISCSRSLSQRIVLGHQPGRRFIVLGHQYGRRDVMRKHSIDLQTAQLSQLMKWIIHDFLTLLIFSLKTYQFC